MMSTNPINLSAAALVVPARICEPAPGPSFTALAALSAAVQPFGARIHAVSDGLVTLAADIVGPYWRGTPRDVLLAASRARRATQPVLTFDVALGRSR